MSDLGSLECPLAPVSPCRPENLGASVERAPSSRFIINLSGWDWYKSHSHLKSQIIIHMCGKIYCAGNTGGKQGVYVVFCARLNHSVLSLVGMWL